MKGGFTCGGAMDIMIPIIRTIRTTTITTGVLTAVITRIVIIVFIIADFGNRVCI